MQYPDPSRRCDQDVASSLLHIPAPRQGIGRVTPFSAAARFSAVKHEFQQHLLTPLAALYALWHTSPAKHSRPSTSRTLHTRSSQALQSCFVLWPRLFELVAQCWKLAWTLVDVKRRSCVGIGRDASSSTQFPVPCKQHYRLHKHSSHRIWRR
jgi:hypothetical protein